MNQQEVFGNAKWVAAGPYAQRNTEILDVNGTPNFPILRGNFNISKVTKATLRVVGLGFFHCYINGKEVSEDQFLPLSTDFEERPNWPKNEKVTGHRLYVPEYDVTNLIEDGKNVIVIWYGGGWYIHQSEHYGTAKAIYRLTVETENGTFDFVSSENDKVGDSPIKTYSFTMFENRDDNGFDYSAFEKDFDDSSWKNAIPAKPLETEYLFSDCPADRKAYELEAFCTSHTDNTYSYDCGCDITGYPVLKVNAAKGEKIEVMFSEEINPDGTHEKEHCHDQRFTYISDGKQHIIKPAFTWFGFRYFSVTGNAVPLNVDVIYSAIKNTSTFECDNETLNWLYKAYVNTQLCNMHAGIPSDCPHIERRGYTGDGELTCHAAMDILDSKEFYKKWIEDISDCQDVFTGHVQYTAPYTHSGGGPGAWGCAIVEVPYQYYKHFGDIEPFKKLYPQMMRYFDYLERHSENNLITSDKKGEWCLGDWCTLAPVIIPAPMVNTYYYIRSMKRIIEVASVIGREVDVPMLENRIEIKKAAIKGAYLNTWNSTYVGGLQGANAFAVDIGLHDDRPWTYGSIVKTYNELGHYDTGICGTDVLTRVLFEHGDAETAVKLLTSTHPSSFDGFRQLGATTIWEYWPYSTRNRSHSHPMFGAVTAYLFDFILGIRQDYGKAGFNDITIEPCFVKALNKVSGSRTLPAGEVKVSYERKGKIIAVNITIPSGIKATFKYGELVKELVEGQNTVSFEEIEKEESK